MTGRIEKTVFISYRRANLPWAQAVYQDLTTHGYDTFFDFQSINSGDFSRLIIENIKGRAHFVLLLTPSALERCNDPNDWLRKEIELAIYTRRNIVPLLLDNFDFNNPETSKRLIGMLSKLKSYNGLRIPSEYFDEGMKRLRERFLNVTLDSVLHPISASVKKATQEQQRLAAKGQKVELTELEEWLERGDKQLENYEFTDAIRSYTEAIRLDPYNAIAYRSRSRAFRLSGNPDDAIRDCDEALSIDPKYMEAYISRGIARKIQGDIEGAISDYTEAIHLQPDSEIAYYYRGNARIAINDINAAIKDYTSAIRLDSGYISAYKKRMNLLFQRRDYFGALSDLFIVLEDWFDSFITSFK